MYYQIYQTYSKCLQLLSVFAKIAHFWNKHAVYSEQKACGKPVQQQAGLGVANTHKNAINTN